MAAEQYVMKIGEDGSVSQTKVTTEYEKDSQLTKIIAMIEDPDAPLAPIKRLIAGEIAKANREMMAISNNEMAVMDGMRMKALDSQVKALRELGKELSESDVLSKKDILNWNGQKIVYVLEEYRLGAEEALKKIGVEPSIIQSFLRLWRDIMTEKEPTIRKVVEKGNMETEK